MRTNLVVIAPPLLEFVARIGHGEEDLYVQALIPQPTVEDSMYPFSTGRPGRMKSR